MASNVDDEMAKLRHDFDQLRADMQSLMKTMKDTGTRRSREAWEKAQQTGESLTEEVDELQKRAEKKIGDYPMTSVLSSFGLGFLIGILLDRRH